MSIYLNDFIQSQHSFRALLPVARRLSAKLSFWGESYIEVEAKNDEASLNYVGSIPTQALLNRILEIIKDSGRDPSILKDFSSAEHKECLLLESEINRLYLADNENFGKCNLITKIFVVLRGFFNNYQFKWNDDVWGCGRQILQRGSMSHIWNEEYSTYIWNNDVQRYKRDIAYKKQKDSLSPNTARVDWGSLLS